MNKGIITVTIDDPNLVVVNVRDERGNVTEAHNVGIALADAHRFHKERDHAQDESEKIHRTANDQAVRIMELEHQLAQLKKARLVVEQTKIDELFKLLKDFHDALPGLAAWQLIETAPTDGTSLLTYGRHGGENVAKWSKDFKRWIFPNTDCEPLPQPTHWMPLPEAPR